MRQFWIRSIKHLVGSVNRNHVFITADETTQYFHLNMHEQEAMDLSWTAQGHIIKRGACHTYAGRHIKCLLQPSMRQGGWFQAGTETSKAFHCCRSLRYYTAAEKAWRSLLFVKSEHGKLASSHSKSSFYLCVIHDFFTQLIKRREYYTRFFRSNTQSNFKARYGSSQLSVCEKECY